MDDIQLSDNDSEKIFNEYSNSLDRALLSNSENYDRSILTLSTAALGLSITIIKDIVPLASIVYSSVLYTSWVFYTVAIIATICSFIYSQWGIKKQRIYAEKYYLNKEEEYFNKKNIPALITTWLNHISGIFFILGIGLTIFFVINNISNLRSNQMSDKDGKNVPTIITNISVPSGDMKINAAEIPQMRPVGNFESNKGAEMPRMRPIVSQQNQQNTPVSQGASQDKK